MNTTAGKWKPKYPDQDLCNADGWGVFYTGIQDATHNLYELQRVDEMRIFSSDNDAIRHVCDLAEQGSKLHIQALSFLCAESPNEIDSIFREVVGSVRLNKLLYNLNLKP